MRTFFKRRSTRIVIGAFLLNELRGLLVAKALLLPVLLALLAKTHG